MAPHKVDSTIGTLHERSLHASLKEWYSISGDTIETPIDGYIIDIVRDNLLIEIQTRNFAAIKKKLKNLTKSHPVRLVYPIPVQKWVVRESPDGLSILSRRKSPKKKGFANIFEELVRIPELIVHSNFSIDALLIHEEEVRRKDGRRNWKRKGWNIIDRRLLQVIDSRLFRSPSDFLSFIPASLKKPFTNANLTEATNLRKNLVQKMTYSLRKMGAIRVIGKKGNAFEFEVSQQKT